MNQVTHHTTEQLTEIEKFAGVYMLIDEIAMLTGVDEDCLRDKEDPAGIAFQKGRLRRKAEYHSKLIQLSNQLSSPAMAIEYKIAESIHLTDQRKR